MPGSLAATIPVIPEGTLEPGDRLEVVPGAGGVLLPEILVVNRVPLDTLEDEVGRPLPFTLLPDEGRLVLPEAGQVVGDGAAAVWLEYQERGRFRLVVEPTPPAGPGEATTEQGIRVHFDPEDGVRVRARERAPASLPAFDLALRAARLASHAGSDQLLCLPLVRDMEKSHSLFQNPLYNGARSRIPEEGASDDEIIRKEDRERTPSVQLHPL